jgi:hypothetical protein
LRFPSFSPTASTDSFVETFGAVPFSCFPAAAAAAASASIRSFTATRNFFLFFDNFCARSSPSLFRLSSRYGASFLRLTYWFNSVSFALSVMLLVDRMAELMELNLVEPKAVRMAAWVVMLAVRLAAMSDSWADRWVLPLGLCLAVMLVDLMVVRSAEKWVVAMAYSLVAMSAVSLVVYLVAKRVPLLVVEMVFPTAEQWAAWSVFLRADWWAGLMENRTVDHWVQPLGWLVDCSVSTSAGRMARLMDETTAALSVAK